MPFPQFNGDDASSDARLQNFLQNSRSRIVENIRGFPQFQQDTRKLAFLFRLSEGSSPFARTTLDLVFFKIFNILMHEAMHECTKKYPQPKLVVVVFLAFSARFR